MGFLDSVFGRKPASVPAPVDKNRALIALSESESTEFGRKDVAAQSPEQRVFSLVWAIDGAVHMDGFAGYLGGYSGEGANGAPEALEAIGAPQTADIVRRAFAVVSDGPLPDDDDARAELASSLNDEQLAQLDALDQEFYARPEDLTGLLFDFVAARPGTFGPMRS